MFKVYDPNISLTPGNGNGNGNGNSADEFPFSERVFANPKIAGLARI